MSAAPKPARPQPDLHGHLLASLKAHWKGYRKQLGRCREDFDEISVHDLRVEIRRLLSLNEVLGVFLPERRLKKARKLLKAHLDTFDELRDLQVQGGRLARLARRHPPARLLADHLSEREVRCRRKTRQAVARFEAGAVRRLVARFRREIRDRRRRGLAAPDLVVLLRALQRAFARVERLRAAARAEDPASIHRTRIAFKKYRYAIEALAPLLPGASPAVLRAMHAYQTLMGNIQDLQTLLAALDLYRAAAETPPTDLGPFRAALERRHQSCIRAYFDKADHLERFSLGALQAPPRPRESSIPRTA